MKFSVVRQMQSFPTRISSQFVEKEHPFITVLITNSEEFIEAGHCKICDQFSLSQNVVSKTLMLVDEEVCFI